MSERDAFRDDETELALLGAVLSTPSLAPILAAKVVADDFGLPAHGVVWDVILSLHASARAIDLTTLSAELRRRDRYNTISSFVRLASLPHMACEMSEAEEYARIVADNARARRVAKALHRGMLRLASAGTPRDLVAQALDDVTKAAHARTDLTAVPLAELAMDYSAHLDEVQRNGGRLVGLSTGLRDLDRITGGMRGGQLIVAGGRPGMGKTSLAMKVARTVFEIEQQRVAFFSLEMPRRELWERMLCDVAGLDSSIIHRGEMQPHQRESLNNAAQYFSTMPLEIFDESRVRFEDIRAVCLQLKATKELGLVVIDYLALIEMPGRTGRESTEALVGETTKRLKQLAKELDVPVLLLSQLNRKCEDRTDKRPTMGDLRESGQIEAHADAVWLLYRDEVYNPDSSDKGIAEVLVAKQRGGLTGRVRVAYIRHLTRFADLAEDRERPPANGNVRRMAARTAPVAHATQFDSSDSSEEYHDASW